MINLQWTEPQDTKPKRHPALYSRPQESIKPRLASKVSYTEPSDLTWSLQWLETCTALQKRMILQDQCQDLAHLGQRFHMDRVCVAVRSQVVSNQSPGTGRPWPGPSRRAWPGPSRRAWPGPSARSLPSCWSSARALTKYRSAKSKISDREPWRTIMIQMWKSKLCRIVNRRDSMTNEFGEFEKSHLDPFFHVLKIHERSIEHPLNNPLNIH